MSHEIIRHGDVVIELNVEGKDVRQKTADFEELVLAKGEMTGHAHRLRGNITKLQGGFWPSENYLELPKPATLTHEEHKVDKKTGEPIVVPATLPDRYHRYYQQREYWGRERRVID